MPAPWKKRTWLWQENYYKPRQYIEKQRHYFANQVKAMVFPVVRYGCESWTIKKAECRRTDAFELWCWRRLLRVPWTARRSNQSILKEISPEYSLEGLMLKLKLQYFGHLMWRTVSFAVVSFSSCLQSFLASRSFLMSQFFASRGQSTGASASASVLLMNINDWFPLGLTGWISLLSMGLSRGFSNSTVGRLGINIELFLWGNL